MTDKIDDGFEPVVSTPTKKEHPALRHLKHKATVAKKIAPKDTAAIFLKDVKDPELKAVIDSFPDIEDLVGHHKNFGYVNSYGVLFPVKFKTKDFHVGWQGNVVVNRCPQCGHRNSAEEAIKGVCSNERAGVLKEPCGYSAVEILDSIKSPKEALE